MLSITMITHHDHRGHLPDADHVDGAAAVRRGTRVDLRARVGLAWAHAPRRTDIHACLIYV